MTWQGHPRTSTAEWKRTRRRILQRDGHRCQLRYPGRCIGTATECDHITPGAGDHDTNLQAACTPCHRHKSAHEGVTARQAKPQRRRTPEPHPGLTKGGG